MATPIVETDERGVGVGAALPDAAVLLVEDDDALRDALAEVLADHGIPAVGVANGRAALDLLARWRPGVLLVDLMMPVMNGFELEAAMRADPRFAALPILYMTASTGHRASASPLFLKPLHVDSLVRAIRSLLRPD